MKRAVLASLVLTLFAAAQISLPQIGFIRDLRGDVRPVLGVRGAFVLGNPVLAGAVSAASFGGEYALADTGEEIVLIRHSEPVWRAAASTRAEAFGFRRDGHPDWVRFTDGSCVIWNSQSDKPEKVPSCPQSAVQPAAKANTSARIPEGVGTSAEPVSKSWVALRGPDRLYLASTESEEAIFEVPEAAEQ